MKGTIPAALAFVFLATGGALALPLNRLLPAPEFDPPGMEQAQIILAGGCFWGVQAVFQHVDGVSSALAGYAGGNEQTAHYYLVRRGDTGHAEAVLVTFDPTTVSAGDLLRIFFSTVHDPTQLNKQDGDLGTQYRSQIYTTSPEQLLTVERYIEQLASEFDRPIVTQVDRASEFFPAELNHQNYVTLHPNDLYVITADQPKLRATARLFPSHWREQPVLE